MTHHTTIIRSFTSLCYAFLFGHGSEVPRGVYCYFGCLRDHVFGEPVLDPSKARWSDGSPCSELIAEGFKRGFSVEKIETAIEDVRAYVRMAERDGLVHYRTSIREDKIWSNPFGSPPVVDAASSSIAINPGK